MIFAINGSAIPNFVLEADSKETCSKQHAVQQNVYVYYVVVFAYRERFLCHVEQDHCQCEQNIKLDQRLLMHWFSDTDHANSLSVYVGSILQFILKPRRRTVVF
jgi:hypothetical protein